MERFIPVECFRKKGNTFRGITFFSLLPEFPEISVPFVHNYQYQASHGNFSEMTAMPRWRVRVMNHCSKPFIPVTAVSSPRHC